MSTTTDRDRAEASSGGAPVRHGRRARFAAALRQWPLAAATSALYAAVVTWAFLPAAAESGLSPGVRTALLLFFAFLLATEACLVTLTAAGLDALAPRWLRAAARDALKAAGLAAALGVLALSLVKFRATSVHLRPVDLWFGARSLAQLWQESQTAELGAALGFLGGLGLLLGGLWVGFRRVRRTRGGPTVGRFLLLTAILGAGTLATFAAHRPVRLIAVQFLPELHWLEGRLRSFSLPRRTPTAAPESGRGAAIVAYRPQPPERPLNVVLVMLESVPWNRTPFAGAPPEAAPNLVALAAESTLFSHAYTTSSQSDYAEMAILSSLHPRKYDRHDFYIDLEYPRTLLWDALEPAGYTTSMFSCQNERWGNMLHYLNAPGPDVLRHSLDWPRARHKGTGTESKVWEETPVAEWEDWLRWRRGPFFTYLNFQANHFPYSVPPEAERPFTPNELDFPASFLAYPPERAPVMLNRFYNALRYADRYLGRVIEALRRRGEWDRTVLVVVSDHGEAFYEHAQPTHGTSLYEEQVRALLLLRVPGRSARRVDAPVSLLDVAPTLLRVLGLPPHPNFQGRDDILEAAYDGSRRPLLFTLQGMTEEDGLLLDGWKLVVDWSRRERRLFDLRADPGETRNLIETAPARAQALERELFRLLERQLRAYREKVWKNGYFVPPLP